MRLECSICYCYYPTIHVRGKLGGQVEHWYLITARREPTSVIIDIPWSFFSSRFSWRWRIDGRETHEVLICFAALTYKGVIIIGVRSQITGWSGQSQPSNLEINEVSINLATCEPGSVSVGFAGWFGNRWIILFNPWVDGWESKGRRRRKETWSEWSKGTRLV